MYLISVTFIELKMSFQLACPFQMNNKKKKKKTSQKASTYQFSFYVFASFWILETVTWGRATYSVVIKNGAKGFIMAHHNEQCQ